MHLAGKAKKVTIFVGQVEGEHGKASYVRILERLKAEGAAGATAFKAIAAFGARSHIQTTRLADVVPDLPVMIVWIDSAERIDRIVPLLHGMVPEGLIAVEETEVVLYSTTAMPELSETVTVGDVMTRDVVTVQPDAPMRDVVEDLVQRRIRAVPVVDREVRVVGIITNGDLVRRGGLPVRLELLQSLDALNVKEGIGRLAEPHREAREVMTAPVVTIGPAVDIQHAAQIMCRNKLKRLPVVDESGRLIGIVSRYDLLHTLAAALSQQSEEHQLKGVEAAAPIRSIMSRAATTVLADAPLSAVIAAVTSTRLYRAIVVDEKRHVLGIVTENELIECLAPHERPGLIATLMSYMPFGSRDWDAAQRPHSTARRAREVMLSDFVVAQQDEPIANVLPVMLQQGGKIIPVVDGSRQLAGVVDRADLLGVLVKERAE